VNHPTQRVQTGHPKAGTCIWQRSCRRPRLRASPTTPGQLGRLRVRTRRSETGL
jgi:hypothetical protein